MNEAIETDKENIENKKPAIEKLKLLSTIKQSLDKVYLREDFLEMSGLERLHEWIRPSTSYPCVNQIEDILDILNILPVDASHLNNSSIAKTLLDISKNYNGPRKIKDKAKNLFEKWARLIFDVNSSYASMDYDTSYHMAIFSSRKRNRNDSEEQKKKSKNVELETAKKRNSTYIPKKDYFDFVVTPKANINEESRSSIGFSNENSDIKRLLVNTEKRSLHKKRKASQ